MTNQEKKYFKINLITLIKINNLFFFVFFLNYLRDQYYTLNHTL